MKFLVVFACALLGANALDQALVDEMVAHIQEIGIECAESEKATPEDLEALMNHKEPPTHAGRCVIFCVSKKLDIMKDDGSISVPKSEWLDKVKSDDADLFAKMENLYKTCKDKVQPKPDGCDTAFEYAACAKSEAQKVGLDKYIEA